DGGDGARRIADGAGKVEPIGSLVAHRPGDSGCTRNHAGKAVIGKAVAVMAVAAAVGGREPDDAVDERRDGAGASRDAAGAAADRRAANNVADRIAQAIAERTDRVSKPARASAADQAVDRSGDSAKRSAGKCRTRGQSERRTGDEDIRTHLVPPS